MPGRKCRDSVGGCNSPCRKAPRAARHQRARCHISPAGRERACKICSAEAERLGAGTVDCPCVPTGNAVQCQPTGHMAATLYKCLASCRPHPAADKTESANRLVFYSRVCECPHARSRQHFPAKPATCLHWMLRPETCLQCPASISLSSESWNVSSGERCDLSKPLPGRGPGRGSSVGNWVADACSLGKV